MTGYATCEACSRTYFECVCSKACGLCGIVTNHTTAQHEAAVYACAGCGEDVREWMKESEVDDESVECPGCRQDRIEARVDDWYDSMAKSDEGGEQ
jgi:DNA-directed RNA polymerase subunit RPC12/RpoP